MKITTVGVVGCGLMGAGITQVTAAAGYDVIVQEMNDELLAKGVGSIDKFLAASVSKGRLAEEGKNEIMGRIRGATKRADLAACQLIIEAVSENKAIKEETFRDLDALAAPEAILASNTSTLCVIDLAMATKRPQQVLGLHFFNPVPLMALVEVIRTLVTSDETFSTVYEFAASVGKEPVATVDKPGFIVNRLLVPYMTDAVRALEEGIGSVEDIDKAMKLGCGYPMGPFTLLDLVGLDTAMYCAEALYEEFREARFAPPTLLRRMVRAGQLGRKTGKGFYTYQ